MKRILILGSTGSIGTQALEIIRNNKDKFKAVGLTGRSRLDVLLEQIMEFEPETVCVGSAEDAAKLAQILNDSNKALPEIVYGDEGLVQIAGMDCDIVLNSLMGISGLAPTYKAISNGRDIALANKETLVAGGEIITELCREKGVRLLPVDSEHSAIFQCLEGNGGSACGRAYDGRTGGRAYSSTGMSGKYKGTEAGRDEILYVTENGSGAIESVSASNIRRILLTASGGPFRGRTLEEMRAVTIEQALNHPKWSMGSKITIDSATMMNKGLEVIEARWLFDVTADKIDIHVHPESIVHSMVEFMDGSVMAQMGLPDMKIPISYALNYPRRMDLLPEFSGLDADRGKDGSLDLFTTGSSLTFEKPDSKVFKCIDLAYAAINEGGSAPIVMNGANEELVAMFLAGEIRFLDIADTIEKVMESIPNTKPGSVEEILEIDKKARARVREVIKA